MNLLKYLGLSCAFALWQVPAQQMPFRNLGFDEAITNNVVYFQPPYIDEFGRGSFPRGSATTADLLRGWQYLDEASNPIPTLGFNYLGTFVTPTTILGRETSFLGYPVEGRYGVLIISGADGGSRSLVQRGDVPMDRPFLRYSYRGSPGSLRIDGQPAARLDQPSYGTESKPVYFDLTQFAGRNVELQVVFSGDPFLGPESGFLDSFEFVVVIPPPTLFNSDFNHDGFADLLFQDDDGFVGVWYMEGTRLKSASFLKPGHLDDTRWRIVGVGDFDRTNRADHQPYDDLLFQHDDGSLAVWQMFRTNLESAVFLDPIRPDDANWRVAATGDFNKDGKIDIVFQHADGELALWYMDGFKMTGPGYFMPSHPGDPAWRVVGAADINSDGKPDLVFQHDDGTLAVWLMDGIKLREGRLLNPSQPGGTWKIVAP